MFKKQSGITLIALVITIIVLLILAGVSISLVIGDNGILTQATDAVIQNKAADAREDLNVALAATETLYYGQWVKNTSIPRKDVYFGELNTLEGQLSNLGYTLEVNEENLIADTTVPAQARGIELTITNNDTSEKFVFSNVVVDEESGKASLMGTLTVQDQRGGEIGVVDLAALPAQPDAE